MVIFLDSGLHGALDVLSDAEKISLSNLALAANEGNHLVICPIPLAKALSLDGRFGDRERIFFKRAAAEYPVQANIVSQVRTAILVTREGFESAEISDRNRQFRVVALKHFEKLDSVLPTKLVCEDLSDCTLLATITKVFLKKTGFKKVTLMVDPVNGGGANTWYSLKRISENERRMALCVVDTDRKPTSWKMGDTAKKVKRFMDANPSHRLDYHILNCHELENMTPDELFLGHRRDFPVACVPTGRKIATMSGIGLNDSRLHLDIKKGLKLKELLKCASNSACSAVWEPLLVAIDEGKLDVGSNCASCVATRQCRRPGLCECVVFNPLGEELLKAAESVWRTHGKDLWASLPEFLKELLSDVCLLIGSWGCAPLPQRS